MRLKEDIQRGQTYAVDTTKLSRLLGGGFGREKQLKLVAKMLKQGGGKLYVSRLKGQDAEVAADEYDALLGTATIPIAAIKECVKMTTNANRMIDRLLSRKGIREGVDGTDVKRIAKAAFPWFRAAGSRISVFDTSGDDPAALAARCKQMSEYSAIVNVRTMQVREVKPLSLVAGDFAPNPDLAVVCARVKYGSGRNTVAAHKGYEVTIYISGGLNPRYGNMKNEAMFSLAGGKMQQIGNEPLRLQPNTFYHIGASSSPEQVMLLKVDDEWVTIRHLGSGNTRKLERPIFSNLATRGITTWLKQGYATYNPELADKYRDLLKGKAVKPENPRDWDKLNVTFTVAPGHEGTDVYGIAKDYGVATDWSDEAETVTAEGVFRKYVDELEADPRLKILSVKPS